jgi:transglutaminase-like putative cysteine protease
MRYEIRHRTTYTYSQEVSVSHQMMRLSPRPLPRQQLVEHSLETDPQPAVISRHEDYFGNMVSVLCIERPHRELVLNVRSVVEVSADHIPAPDATPPWETVRDLCRSSLQPPEIAAAEYIFKSPFVPCRPEFANYARASFPESRPLAAGLLDLTSRIHRDFKFDPSATTVSTPVDQVFRSRRGVCQDFAHFQIACLRSLGLPARYVSGYLETLPPPGKPKLAGADASHAWVQAWCGDHGWLDVDPTNNLPATQHHLTLAWGRDFGDVTPIRGVLVGGGHHLLSVAVDVTACPETNQSQQGLEIPAP